MNDHINKPQSALLLGAGYVAARVTPELQARGYDVTVTTRSGQTGIANVRCLSFDCTTSLELQTCFAQADVIMTSIPPNKDGIDPVLKALGHIEPRANWIAYLSATSVYGDRAGRWAYEGEPPTPTLRRGRTRADAELAWIETLWPVHIFRLAGIYGPTLIGKSRSPFRKLRDGTARAVIKKDHVVNRIHVDDIVSALLLSHDTPNPQSIYNLADGHPAPPQDVLDYAAGLLGCAPPSRVSVESDQVSKMARTFYSECKRINADKARQDFGWQPLYPTYRDGLEAILNEDG